MSQNVPTKPSSLPTGRTRWSRFALVAGLGTVIAGGLVLATATAALPASFAVSGLGFKISADRIEGREFTQFFGLSERSKDSFAVTGASTATLEGLCFSAALPTPFGPAVLRATAGGKNKPVTARNLVVTAADIQADLAATNLALGMDAARIFGPVQGASGEYAHQAETVVLKNFRGSARSTTAGTFQLTGLQISVKVNGKECY